MRKVKEDDLVYTVTVWKKPNFDGFDEGEIVECGTFLDRDLALKFAELRLKKDTKVEIAYVPAYKVAEFAAIEVEYE